MRLHGPGLSGYWRPFGVSPALNGAVVLWRRLPTAVKSITNSPGNGKTRRHIAQWRSGNYDQLLSGHVGYARHALVHPSVRERFGLAEVTQCAGRGPYRPLALAGHREFKGGYLAAQAPGEGPATKLA